MTAGMITDNPMVRALYELPAPVVTAYLRAPDLGTPDDRDLRLRAMLDQLHPTEATPESLRALASVLGAVTEDRPIDPGRPTVAAFVGADGQTRMFELPEADVQDQIRVAAVPHVLPLLEWRQGRPAYVLVLLDRTGAELVVQPAGAAPAARTEVQGPDDEIERNAPGGWSQPRYQNRAEDSWQHNAGRAAEAVSDALSSVQADLLIVSGDVRAEQYFRDQLPSWIHSKVTIKTITGSRSPDGSEEHRRDRIAAAVQEYVDQDSVQALARIREHSGPGGLGVQSPAATIHALARGQVHVLVLAADEPGAQPVEPTTAWFGPQPTDISEHRSGVLVPDGKPSHGPLKEVLARAAILTDADIRILPQGWPDPPTNGVGALCRFTVS